jgi:hypothetical protein
MKKYFLFIALFCVWFNTQAQIPNPSFENWSTSGADGWQTFGLFHSAVQRPHQGNLAIESQIVQTSSSPYEFTHQFFQTGGYYPYIPITGKPTRLLGWLIFQGAGDTMYAEVNLKSAGTIIGHGQFMTSTTYTNYTQFILNINYSSAAMPDSFMILFDFKSNINVGSNFIVDDLSMDEVVGITENVMDPSSITFFPNPAQDKISFFNSNIQNNKITEIEAYSSSGQLALKKVFKEEDITEMDISPFTGGLYFFKITLQNGAIVTKKVVKG